MSRAAAAMPGYKRSGGVTERTDGIAHVVQRVEEADQVVGSSVVIVGARGLEADAVGDPGSGGGLPGHRDRFPVRIEAAEGGPGEDLGHEDRGVSVAAADVGDSASGLELGHDPSSAGSHSATRPAR